MNHWSHLPKKENRDEEQTPNNNFSPDCPSADTDQTGSSGNSTGIVQDANDHDSRRYHHNLSDL